MTRILTGLAAAAFLAAAATAQCNDFTNPGTLLGAGDDSLFAVQPLGFTFTMAGSAGTTTWTHFRATTNGVLMLTDAAGTLTSSPGSADYGSVAASSATSLYGPAGSNPRIAAYWRDLNSSGAGNGVFFDNTTSAGVSCKVSWKNVVDFGGTAQKSFSAEIFANGNIVFSYAAGTNVTGFSPAFVGISCANGLTVPAASDFTPGPASSATGGMHQSFATGTFDIASQTITFVPNGAGWDESVTCQVLPASHTSYGAGCYNFSDSAHQSFSTSAAASAALSNTAITFAPNAGSYQITAAGSFLPVGSVQAVPTIVANGDDTETVVPFTVGSFPGSTGLAICSNGFVSLATGNSATFNQTAALLLNGTQTSFRSAHDMNPTEPGSGQIKYEESAGVTMVTWDGVYDYDGLTAADANTIQMQFYPNGTVVIAWGTLSTLGASGIGHYVGYSPAGPSNVNEINFATQLPYQVATINAPAISLAASPAPVSTVGSGTLVTYTQTNIPEAAPASGVYLGTTIISLGQDLPGTSLALAGMPGCNLHIASLDLLIAFVGTTNSLTTQFQVPAGVSYGFQLYAQAAALVVPNSLPNGQNAFGATVSNGVASFISAF